MVKAVSIVLLIAVMLVAFIGQTITFSTAMSCESSEDSLSAHLGELIKNQDTNSPSADTGKSDDCCGIECCDVECICIANACSSFAYVNTGMISLKTSAFSEAFYIQQLEHPNAVTTVLYRPPII
jgi:hypothetical protein